MSMSDNYPSIDKRQNNGKSTNRIETGGGDLSTTVQSGKAASAFVASLVSELPLSGTYINKYAGHNVQETRSRSKSVRGKSDVGGYGKRGPTPSEKDNYLTLTAGKYKIGGERIR